jgi:hypothetical protein
MLVTATALGTMTNGDSEFNAGVDVNACIASSAESCSVAGELEGQDIHRSVLKFVPDLALTPL